LAAPFFGQQRLDESPATPEPLVLTAEETFYLFSVKQALMLHRSADSGATTSRLSPGSADDEATLWRDLATADVTFVKRYCAYRHYRDLGWIPRSGLKYGTDFLLYEYAPDVDHAAYQVVVVAVDGSTGGLLTSLSPHGAPHWRTISTVNRIAAGVLKRMAVCYVTFPDAGADFGDVAVAGAASLSAVVVKRWAPHRARPPSASADPAADEDDLEQDDGDEDSFG
jgi:tRNA-splicing endonuclease subunit Sen2